MTKFDPLVRGADITLPPPKASRAVCAQQDSESAQARLPFAGSATGTAARRTPTRGRAVRGDGAVAEEPSIGHPLRFQEGSSR